MGMLPDLPTSCNDCRFFMDGNQPLVKGLMVSGTCCGLYKYLLEEDLEVDPEILYHDCPLRKPDFQRLINLHYKWYKERYNIDLTEEEWYACHSL